ncbi:MAG: hypothetical protein ICV62_10765 [Cyanobacteria bacterium Co-bin13]|nr:hypothetical protein [Cyanobacteria bacterium Co-bin13]
MMRVLGWTKAWSRVWRTAVRALIITALALSVMGCGGLSRGPADAVIEQAVVRQFEATQQELQQQLSLEDTPADFQISRVKVERTQQVKLQDLPAYRVEGTYRLTGRGLSRTVRQSRHPFEIYLQSQDGGETWGLVRPIG